MYGQKKTKNSGHTDPHLFVRVSRRIYTRITATTMHEWCDLVKSDRTEIVLMREKREGKLHHNGVEK
ncbi:Uncharacterized protein FWK35_00014352 [Aphis craccivora]|uniref:Uncharacterized protein n=1 Tax=Aphis craccivora TaxID=307492 RepID=A0A6G0Z3Z4_APHCR|nr:Uncharacterized protein FWK35_00014352 [Aphis craccivora]